MPKKKTRFIKRVYEQGKEITMPVTKKQRAVASRKRQPDFKETKLPLSQETVQKKDFAVRPSPSPATAQRPSLIEHCELSPRYGTTFLTLMVKDPFWIYAYWEITPSNLAALSKNIGPGALESAKIILRMYEVSLIDFNGSNANHFFDIEVGHNIDNWYVNLWHDSVSYVGEIGLRTRSRQFYALARSNTVHTPRASYSRRSEQIWMEVRDGIQTPAYVIPQLKPQLVPAQPRARAVPVHKRERVIYYLSEEEIRAYYAKLNLLLRDVISSKLSKFWSDERPKAYLLLEGETPQERELILSRLPRDYFIKRLTAGASENLLVVGASEQRLGGPGAASDFLHEKIKRKFFFELAAELIVYGRTEPDAQVWLGGKKIPLRLDGTFSLRLSLPDGKIPLEFTALSCDGQQKRKINTCVQRTTDYSD